jgi:hypothetical protein
MRTIQPRLNEIRGNSPRGKRKSTSVRLLVSIQGKTAKAIAIGNNAGNQCSHVGDVAHKKTDNAPQQGIAVSDEIESQPKQQTVAGIHYKLK